MKTRQPSSEKSPGSGPRSTRRPAHQGPGGSRQPERQAPCPPVRPGGDSERASDHNAVIVPKDAVQRRNRQDLVFIPEADGTYRPQIVRVSRLARRNVVEVTSGLKPGQTGRHDRGVPAQDGDHEGRHGCRLR